MLLSALSITLAAQAAHDCQPDHLGPEDLAIMASVRAPQPGTEVLAEATAILYGVATDRGQLSEEDIAIIRSVQPVGAGVVLCPTDRSVLN